MEPPKKYWQLFKPLYYPSARASPNDSSGPQLLETPEPIQEIRVAQLVNDGITTITITINGIS